MAGAIAVAMELATDRIRDIHYGWILPSLCDPNPIPNPHYENVKVVLPVLFCDASLQPLDLKLGGTSSLTLSFAGTAVDPDSGDGFWGTARSWKIVNSTGTGTNIGATNFSEITNGTYLAGSFSTVADASGNVVLNFTPIPEPGTASLLAAAVGLSLRRRRGA
jgi:hypothetical protein